MSVLKNVGNFYIKRQKELNFILNRCLSGVAKLSDRNAASLRYKDPYLGIQQFYAEPILADEERPFRPSLEHMREVEKRFRGTKEYPVEFMLSAFQEDQWPSHDLPEVVFIGRSNVGKSSLIQHLLGYGVQVRTSKTPGHTKSLNFFKIGKLFCLVDAPGYGFNQPKNFEKVVEHYFQLRKNLRRVIFLVDGKVGFRPWDQVAVEMLEEFKVPYTFVVTKIDKATQGKVLLNVLHLIKICNEHTTTLCFPQPFLVSSLTQEGLGYLQTYIAHVTDCLYYDLEKDSTS